MYISTSHDNLGKEMVKLKVAKEDTAEKVLGTLGDSREQTVQVTYLGKEKVKLRVA